MTQKSQSYTILCAHLINAFQVHSIAFWAIEHKFIACTMLSCLFFTTTLLLGVQMAHSVPPCALQLSHEIWLVLKLMNHQFSVFAILEAEIIIFLITLTLKHVSLGPWA